MKIVCFAATKGGAGKTTAAWHVAAAIHEAGTPVLLVDSDRQATSIGLAKLGGGDGSDLPPMVSLFGRNLARELPRMNGLYKLAVIDSPGRLVDEIAEAMKVSDLVVIPTQPSANDLMSLEATLKLFEVAKSKRPALQARILLTCAGENLASEETRDAIKRFPIPAFKTSLGKRQAFVKAGFQGRSVTAFAPSSAAAEEVKALVAEIRKTLGGI